ncbi:MAG: hypothetical protein RR569_04915 [Acinetobacter sp.]
MSINGHEAFEQFLDDTRKYFSIDIALEVDKKSNLNKGYFSSSVIGLKNVILIHKDPALKEIANIEDFLYFLFIFCHELAHCINRHNYHKDEAEIDTKAIEAWADYSSTLFAFELLYNGENTNKILRSYLGEKIDLKRLLIHTANTIAEIYQTIFKDSDQNTYPLPSSRFHSTINGVSAFFSDKFSMQGRILVTQKILLNIPEEIHLDVLKWERTESVEEDKQEKVVLTKKILKIHQKIQGKSGAIINDPLLNWNSVFATNYNLYTDEQRDSIRNILKVIYMAELKRVLDK